MPATSKAQQRLMGMAYALKKGEMDPEEASQEVKDLADSMTLQQLRDFAETKHEGLPSHVKEYAYFWWDTQSAQAADMAAGQARDQSDPLVQSFMDFVAGKKKKQVKEDFAAPAASVTNTPGMGNTVAATPDAKGSGDIFGASSKSKKRKKKRHADVYEDWLKNTVK